MTTSVQQAIQTPEKTESPRCLGAVKTGADAFRVASLALVVTLVLAACEPAAQAPTHPDAPALSAAAATSAGVSTAAAATVAEAVPAKTEVPEMTTTTQAILERFAMPAAPAWDAFSELPGVVWNGNAPVAAPGALGAENAMSRAGVIEWLDVAAGTGVQSQGSEAQVPPERAVGLTLLGREAVESIAFRKYRPSTEYEATLHAQLDDGAQLRRIADRCARNYGSRGANTRTSAFLELRFDQRAPLYVEAYADKEGSKYSPGYTTFEVTRTRPDARIADMGCIES